MQVALQPEVEKLVEEYIKQMMKRHPTYKSNPTSVVNVFFTEIIKRKIHELEKMPIARI